jgi:hypothetical protein
MLLLLLWFAIALMRIVVGLPTTLLLVIRRRDTSTTIWGTRG